MPEMNNPGEERAWDLLTQLRPDEVCKSAAVSYEAVSRAYSLRSFGMDFIVSPSTRKITCPSAGSTVLLGKLGYFFRLSVLWYLVNAKDIACSGRPVKLESLPGGDIFSKGSHILPLEPLAQRYARDKAAFLEKARLFDGEPESGGDAAVRLHPLPRVPVLLTLWLEDDEFPARADVLFDSTCGLQLPTDIIWSVAMLSTLVML